MQGKVVHCKKARYDVYVGRPSKWGNPFRSGRDGTRAEVIAMYERWLDSQPQLLAELPSLAGLTLACWCSPLACHADVLARRAHEAALAEADEDVFCEVCGFSWPADDRCPFL